MFKFVLFALVAGGAFSGMSTAAMAQSNPRLTGAGSITDRPIVREVDTPMPVSNGGAPAPASAVVTPVTSAATAPAPTPAAVPAQNAAVDREPQVGDLTRQLFQAQADGRRAGPGLAMLGATATNSWNRYVKSFDQPIPQWFTQTVKQNSN